MGWVPTTAASWLDGCIAFMNAAFGWRLVADFLAAPLAAPPPLLAVLFRAAPPALFFAADFFAAGCFLAADFLAAGFFAADFFAAFLAVAIDSPSCRLCERTTPERSEARPPVTGLIAPSAATIPHFRGKGSVFQRENHPSHARCCRRASRAFVSRAPRRAARAPRVRAGSPPRRARAG